MQKYHCKHCGSKRTKKKKEMDLARSAPGVIKARALTKIQAYVALTHAQQNMYVAQQNQVYVAQTTNATIPQLLRAPYPMPMPMAMPMPMLNASGAAGPPSLRACILLST